MEEDIDVSNMLKLAEDYVDKRRKNNQLLGLPPKRGYMVRPAYLILKYETNVPIVVDWRGSEKDAEQLARELNEQETGLLGASKKGLSRKKSANARNRRKATKVGFALGHALHNGNMSNPEN